MGHQSTGCVGPWMMGGCPPSLWMTPRSLPCHSTRLGGSRVPPTGPASAPVASVGPGLGGDVASIVVSRLKDPWINRFRKIGVEINGSLVGALRPGERGVFAVPVGHVSVRATIDWLGSKNLEFDISHESDPVQLLLSNGSVLAIFDESEPFLDLRLSPESSRAVSAVTMVMTGLTPEQRAARRKKETLRADLVILVGVLALFGTLAFALLSPRGSDVLTPSSALPILLGCWFIAAGTLRRRRAQRRSAR